MHELFLPIMIMIFTLFVMFGLVLVFARWMAERDRLVGESEPASRSPAPAD